MNSKLKKEYNEYFKLEPTVLNKIVDIIKGANLNNGEFVLLFTVTNKENSTYTVTNLQKVLEDDNTIRREIVGLAITACKPEDAEREYIIKEESFITLNWGKVKDYYSSGNVFLSVQKISDYHQATKLFDDIDNQVKRTLFDVKSENSWIRILKWFTDKLETILQLSILWLLLYLTDIIFKLDVFSKTVGELTILNFIILFSVAVLIVELVPYSPLSMLIKNIEGKMVSNSIFYWGDVATIYDKNKKTLNNIKWVIIIGFLVSFTAGILTTLLLK